eukprot:12466841-Ditylum_brightwellii.AAC.2
MEEEEARKTECVKVHEIEEEKNENNKVSNEKNKEEGTRNDEEMKETKTVAISARNEEEDPVPVHRKTIREQIIEAGEKDIGKRNVQVTTICVEFKLKKDKEALNARKVLLDLLHQISKVDPFIYVQDKESDTIWANKHDFPSNKDFLK